MCPTETEQALADLSYLWTSGEWTLHEVHHAQSRVIFVFTDGRPSAQELLAIRRVVPRFAQLPISVLMDELGELPAFVAGEFPNIEAQSLEVKARERALNVRREDTSYTSYLPVNAEGSALIIEDDALAVLVTSEMRKRGVPIVSHSEADQ
jgi:hypothetical protein